MIVKLSTQPPIHPVANPYRQILGAAVESRRNQLGLTVEAAAARAGFEAQQWTDLEEGVLAPANAETITAIAAALKCDPTAISFLALVSRHNR